MNEERPEMPDAVLVDDGEDPRGFMWLLVAFFAVIILGTGFCLYYFTL